MIGIKINLEFLDLPPGAVLEEVEENLFLQFTDQLKGPYTLPLDVDATPKNLRLLQYAGLIQKRINGLAIDAELYDNTLQRNIGKIKIEKPTHNINRVSDGKISIYLLTGASSFYQDIKDKKLRDVAVGGDRSFAWDNVDPDGAGFWGHITDVLNAPDPGYGPSGFDYAFYPVKNMGWPGFDYDINIMNCVEYSGGRCLFIEYFEQGGSKDLNRIVPFPYLKYILEKIAAHVGWTIAGDILDDVDFKKITLINFQAIDFAFIKRLGAGLQAIIQRDPVVFNLRDHLPDVTIAEFLIAIKNRMGLWYDFDKTNKVIRIKKLTAVVNTATKDFTKYANPVIPKTVNQEDKIYALRNQFNPDLSGGAPALDKVALLGSLDELTDLPAAGELYYGKVYYITAENNYYIAENADDGTWSWVLYAYNIYDYQPAGANEEITTAATTVGNEPYDAYMDFVPRIDLQGNWFGRTDTDAQWGIILCFYHGLKNNKAGDPYPFGSSGIYDSAFNQVAEWALTFECKKADGSDVGLYELSWKPILGLLRSSEELEVTLNLPLHEYLNLNFGDRIVIAGVKMWVKQRKSKLPYDNSLVVQAVRIF
jgi:hypothetical protein